MRKFLMLTAAFGMSVAMTLPAHAGRATLVHDNGAVVKIRCASGSCTSRHTHADGTKDKAVRFGWPKFGKVVKQWKSKGYKEK